MMFGARLAQGCTSGHGISGSLQLAVSSWIFVVVFLAVAVGTQPIFGGSPSFCFVLNELEEQAKQNRKLVRMNKKR
jgi:uncharacterized membrane protein YedE/YeeE